MNEVIENAALIIPVAAAIIAGILVFIFSLKASKKFNAKIASREQDIIASSKKVKAYRRDSVGEIRNQGNPTYEYGRRYDSHYTYEVDGKTYKYHMVTRKFPSEQITLLYRNNPKKVIWMHNIPKPAWAWCVPVLLRVLPFVAAVAAFWVFGGSKVI